MDKSKYFYCYSNRLNQFLYIFGIKPIFKDVNPSNNTEYCAYEKTEPLDFLLKQWDYIKERINFGEFISK